MSGAGWDSAPPVALDPITVKQCKFADAVAVAAASGYHHLRLRYPLLARYLDDGHAVAEVAALLSHHHLRAEEMGVLAGWQFHGGVPRFALGGAMDEADWVGETDRFLSVARALGVRQVTAMAAINESGPLAVAIRDYRVLCQAGARHGLDVLLEFAGTAKQINTLAIARAIVEEAAQPNGGLTLDTFLLYQSPWSPGELRGLPADLVRSVHVSDAPPGAARDLDMVRDRLLPGEGVIPLREIMGALADLGYRGGYAIEVFSERYLAEDAITVARRARVATETLLQRHG